MKTLISNLTIYIIFVNIISIFSIEQNKQINPEDEDFNIYNYYYSLSDTSLLLYNLVNHALDNLITVQIKEKFVNLQYLRNFISELSREYNSNTPSGSNPYHNIFHAGDVVQQLYIILKKIKNEYAIITSNEKYKNLDLFTLIIAAAAHDFKHPGRTNSFYRQNKGVPLENELKKYNGQLESYHINEALKLIETENNNILSKLTDDEKERFKLIFTKTINSTDNAFNTEKANFLNEYKEIIKLNDITEIETKLVNKISLDELKIKVLGCLLHAGDLSNPTKNYNDFIIWGLRVNQETCNQSEDEIKYNFATISSCNKDGKDFYNGEKFFVENIVKIFYDPLCEGFPSLNYLCQNLTSNLQGIVVNLNNNNKI